MTGVMLQSDALRVMVNPDVGGTITQIVHRGLDMSVLGVVPWEIVDTPLDPVSVTDERIWLSRYTGGWPLLFPNGGDACTFAGRFHGFHGEASITPWECKAQEGRANLTRRFSSIPVRMQRDLHIADDVLTVFESVKSEAEQDIKVMWGHHPSFGSDLLAGDITIETGARTVTADAGYDPPANPLKPGAVGKWPMVDGKSGPFDLGNPPKGPMAALAYLSDFESSWVAIRRLDNSIAVALSWDADFPCAWLWYELGGTLEPPWNGRTRLIGLEPNTTCLAYGLAEAQRRGARLLTLKPGAEVHATVRLHVFKPRWAITGIDKDGRAG